LSKESTLQYISSRWIDSEGKTISECAVYDPVQIEVQVENPLRKTTITNLVQVAIYRDSVALFANKVQTKYFQLTLSPLSTETKFIYFTPSEESRYHYKIRIEKKEIYCQPKSIPPRLYASKKESSITLNVPSKVQADSTIHFTGKLVSSNPGEGVDGAKIQIYDVRLTRKDNLMASGTTKSDGTFNIECKVKRMRLWHHTIDVYSKFDGDDLYKQSVSNLHTIRLTKNNALKKKKKINF
jgi:hypothetical protein